MRDSPQCLGVRSNEEGGEEKEVPGQRGARPPNRERHQDDRGALRSAHKRLLFLTSHTAKSRFPGILYRLPVNSVMLHTLSLDLSYPLEFLESCTAGKPPTLTDSVTKKGFQIIGEQMVAGRGGEPRKIDRGGGTGYT